MYSDFDSEIYPVDQSILDLGLDDYSEPHDSSPRFKIPKTNVTLFVDAKLKKNRTDNICKQYTLDNSWGDELYSTDDVDQLIYYIKSNYEIKN